MSLPEIPDTETTNKWVDEYKLDITFEDRSLNWWGYVINILPWLFIIVVWLIFLRLKDEVK